MFKFFKKIKKFLTFNCNFELLIFNFKFINIWILFIFFIFFPKPIFSENFNNIFGIHLAQPHLEDLPKVKELVNSNGGDWGYVTLVIQENDRDKNKWQGIFDHLRRLHLIPIIRLATSPVGQNWRRPEEKDADEWVEFLDSLNWVVKNRYIVLFNEPNHGSEWGGEVDEESYAKVVYVFAKKLKEKNQDFFVMMAGFDASAPSLRPVMEDEEVFLRKILIDSVSNSLPPVLGDQQKAGKIASAQSGNPSFSTSIKIFDYIDGWASHSYPNPGFSGSPYDVGRGTIRTYEWELEFLRNFGVNKNLPVFITETGWERQIKNSKLKVKNYLGEEAVAEYFKIAFEQVWLPDSRVWAVTPFVFDYQMEPFLGFSWKRQGSQDFYPQYYTVASIAKIKAEADQIEKGKIKFNLSKELIEDSDYHFKITLLNQGQGYWDNRDYKIELENNKNIDFLSGSFDIAPSEEKEVNIYLKTKNQGKEKIKFVLKKNNKKIIESEDWEFEVRPLPSLKFEVSYWPWGKAKGDNFEIQIFDWEENLVYKKNHIKVEDGQGLVDNIKNITLSDLYRVVIIKPGFLPRQQYFVFRPWGNEIKFKKLLPFDKNNDGKFSFQDIISLFKRS